MNDWIGLINGVKDGSYDREKYEGISKAGDNSTVPYGMNNTSNVVNTNPNLATSTYNQPNNVLNPQNQPQTV